MEFGLKDLFFLCPFHTFFKNRSDILGGIFEFSNSGGPKPLASSGFF